MDNILVVISVQMSKTFFFYLGSSLVVYPAANLPGIAKGEDAILVIINIDPTPLADLVIHESTSKVLSKVV